MIPQTYQIKPDGFAVNENVGVIYGNRNGIDFVILPFSLGNVHIVKMKLTYPKGGGRDELISFVRSMEQNTPYISKVSVNNVEGCIDLCVRLISVNDDYVNLNTICNMISMKCNSLNIINGENSLNYLFNSCIQTINQNMQYANSYQMNNMNQQFSSGPMTKAEFYKHPSIHKHVNDIVGAGIACYIFAGINLIVSVFLQQNIFGIVDVVILLGCGLALHLAKSRAAAIVLTCEGSLGLIASLVIKGTPGGWLILIFGIISIIRTFKVESAWNNYNATGRIE